MKNAFELYFFQIVVWTLAAILCPHLCTSRKRGAEHSDEALFGNKQAPN